MYSAVIKKIEYYLYRYDLLDFRIEELKTNTDNQEYRQTYDVWIKNKNSSLENEAIRNIENERRILRIKKWKALIDEILEEYKNTDLKKYKFICLKYFRKLKPIKIEEKLDLEYKEQKDIQMQIIERIMIVAIKKKILKEVEFQFNEIL